ncbi:WD40 repeat domain-containing protein [bacterium CPR1]|nr:WD40 repeat domain-containing protein [bacterium CPR1]
MSSLSLFQRRALVRQIESPLPLVGHFLRPRALQGLQRAAEGGDVESATELVRLFHKGLVPRELLRSLSHPAARAEVCAGWVGSRSGELEALLLETGWTAEAPPAVRVLTLLLQDQGDEIALGGDRWAPALIQACADGPLADRALDALDRLPDEEARNAACQAVLDSSFPPEAAVERLVAHGWAPSEPVPRALFYFVTGQLQRFADLDYDQSLLRTAYADMSEGLRARVVGRIRESGRPELVRIIQDEPRRRLHGLTPSEYEAVVQVMRSSGRLDDLWAMVFTTAPEWAAEILGILQEDGFGPKEQDRSSFERLCALRPSQGRSMKLQLPELTLNAVTDGLRASIRGLAFSPDGKLLAVGGKSDRVRLWDPYQGRFEGELGGHAGVVSALAFSPDCRVLATGGSDHGAFLWDPRRCRQLGRIFPEEAPVGTLTMGFSPSGRWLGLGGWEATILMDMVANRQHVLEGHTECVVGLAFDPRERWVATASWDRSVRVWDLSALRSPVVLEGHDDRLASLAFTDRGEELVTAGLDGRVLMWRESNRWSSFELLGYHSPPIWKLACDPRGRVVATAGSDGSVRLWGSVVGGGVALPAHSSRTTALAFSPDGTFLAATSKDGNFSVWQLGAADGAVSARRLLAGGGYAGSSPNSLAFAPDSRTLALGYEDGALVFWSLFQTKPVARMDQRDLDRIEKWIKEERITPEDRRAWEFVAELLRHRFRHEIQLGQATGALFDEFAIDVE